jgi:Sulfotransferase family
VKITPETRDYIDPASSPEAPGPIAAGTSAGSLRREGAASPVLTAFTHGLHDGQGAAVELAGSARAGSVEEQRVWAIADWLTRRWCPALFEAAGLQTAAVAASELAAVERSTAADAATTLWALRNEAFALVQQEGRRARQHADGRSAASWSVVRASGGSGARAAVVEAPARIVGNRRAAGRAAAARSVTDAAVAAGQWAAQLAAARASPGAITWQDAFGPGRARLRPVAEALSKEALRLASELAELPGRVEVRPRGERRLAGPVFVGGTGRSGTTILGRLLGLHSALAFVPNEMRFHVSRGGLTDLLAGDVELAAFAHSMRPGGRQGRRLWRHTDPDEFAKAVDRFTAHFPRRPVKAARALLAVPTGAVVRRAGASASIEASILNIARASDLGRAIPDARFVHIVRDGRDVACSRYAKGNLNGSIPGLIADWGRRMAEAERGSAALAPDRLLTIRLEHLVLEEREATYLRLLEFLGLDDEPLMRHFFDTEMTAASAHIGRWREDIPPGRRKEASLAYRTALAQLMGG